MTKDSMHWAIPWSERKRRECFEKVGQVSTVAHVLVRLSKQTREKTNTATDAAL